VAYFTPPGDAGARAPLCVRRNPSATCRPPREAAPRASRRRRACPPL